MADADVARNCLWRVPGVYLASAATSSTVSGSEESSFTYDHDGSDAESPGPVGDVAPGTALTEELNSVVSLIPASCPRRRLPGPTQRCAARGCRTGRSAAPEAH